MYSERRRNRRPGPVLSPAAAKQLVAQFASPNDSDDSSSSESPDSLYSNGSPTFRDQAFEFDGEGEAEEQIEHHDAEDYESLMAESEAWQTPAWGAWPEMGQRENSWSPSPSSMDSPSRGTIISISPAGSLNSRSGKSSSPFRSLPRGKTPSDGSRRGSDPSLLGFELNSPRRLSHARSWHSGRRRSSLLSNGSVLDSSEDARLRNIASMDMLGRRFSEVVEIAGSASEDERFDGAVVRRAISQWSPSSSAYDDDDDDESEIHTAPYFPTPPTQPSVPTVLSNFPLPTVAAEPDSWEDISTASSPTSPAYRPRRLPAARRRGPPRNFATPPPPEQPASLLRQRVRPEMTRAITEYQFPPRDSGVSAGVAAPPRPTLARSISMPFFAATTPVTAGARTKGAFPVSRPAPLGVSPLRESLRRQSIVSDGAGSRRGSTDSRRPSVADSRRPSIPTIPERRFSTARDNDLRRMSIDRRFSLEARRMSVESRRASTSTSTEPRLPRDIPRKASAGSTSTRRSSIVSSRRSSGTSRKNSVVSVSDFGYLAPQIVIDPAPAGPPTVALDLPRFKRNAPPSIILPEYSFPPSTPSGMSTTSDLTTPRYHPMDSFLGKIPSPGMPSTPSTDMEKTPMMPSSASHQIPGLQASIMDRPRPISPPEHSGPTFLPRFRGASSPKMQDPLSPPSASSNSAGPAQHRSPSPPPAPSPVSTSRAVTPDQRHVSRKAVPRLTDVELKAEQLRDELLRLDRAKIGGLDGRGIMMGALSNDEIMLRGAAAHRRAISIEQAPPAVALGTTARPPNRRQTTVPAELDQVRVEQKRQNRKSHVVFEESSWRTPAFLDASSPESSASARISPIQSVASAMVSPTHYAAARISPTQPSLARISPPQPSQPSITAVGSGLKEKAVGKRTSVTFSEETRTIIEASRPTMGRTSSFTRFFKSRPHSVATPSASSLKSSSSSSPKAGSTSRLARPISVDGALINGHGQEKSMTEVREIFRKLGSSPRRSQEEDRQGGIVA